MFEIVLYEPEIPPNTGNIMRLCANTGCRLHLVRPLGFSLSDKQLKRAGMDYWKQVTWHLWPNWAAFREAQPMEARIWFIESDGPRTYIDPEYELDDYLVFGRESAGLPPALLEAQRERWLRIPMLNGEARSLNLSNCVAITLFEALRQTGFIAPAKP